MSDDLAPAPAAREGALPLTSTLYRLCEEVIALREINARQHKLFEQTLSKAREELKGSFNTFAADVQRAYQQMRQDFHGEKRIGLVLLSEVLEIALDLQHIAAARPAADDRDAVVRWMESVEIESRKVEDSLRGLGIHPYDAVIASPYNPALHERVGSTRVEGMGALLIAEQRERGYASQQPEFVLRRPKVIVTE